MWPTKSLGFIIILGIIVSTTIPTVTSQIEKDFLENLKSSLIQKPLTFNATQSRNYNDQLCVQQLEAVLNAMGNFQLWSLRMADAWGKMPSGILSGNLYELGNFDQCIEIEKSVADAGTIKGQYCLAGLILQLNSSEVDVDDFFPGHLENQFAPDDALKQSSSEDIAIQFNIGICVPSTCSPDFLRDIIKSQIETQINFSIAVSLIEDNCYNNEPIEYNAGDIFAIIFFSFVGFLMIASTIYDVYCIRMDKMRNSILIAFSVYTNGEKLFKCNRSKSINVMDCINGIRALSIIWIVYGHTYMTFLNSPTSNLMDLPKWLKNPYSMVIIGASVAVDSFFLMSGLLVAWSMLRHLDKTKGKINIPLLYFHRYLRLTPALAANILFYATLWKLIVIGPTSSSSIKVAEFCDTYWWSALLYIQNYVNPSNMCFGHSWYLSVDMQCFILSPLFIYPLWRWRNKFVWIISIIICLTIGCVFSIYMINGFINTVDKLVGDAQEQLTMEGKTYIATHIRIGAWLVGVLLGYFLHNIKDKKFHLSTFIILLGWIISLSSVLAIVFGIYTMNQQWHETTVLESAFHESLCRVSWAISLSWIIFACVKGYGGPVNWFLSLPVWQPISRLSYSLYLVHLTVLFGITASVRTTLYLTHFNAIHKFWGDFAISILAAILCTLAFESPILILEKILLGQESKSTKSNAEQNKNTVKKQDKV